MNKAESERLASLLEKRGFEFTPQVREADLILVNSCVVRQSAETKVLNKLQALKTLKNNRPEIRIALTGCLAGQEIDPLKQKYPFIDYFFSPGEIPEWLKDDDSIGYLPLRSKVSTFVPIMQGCNNFCSYCIVPYRRGRERSRPLEEIVCEVKELVRRGTKEVVLLGQNVDSYGHDLPDQPDLAVLLHRLNSLEGLLRIRFLTNHPKDIKPELIEAIASLDKVCKQINLPVQSGDDEILRLMNRGYTADHYRELIYRIRNRVPAIALSTDVIVGFPGETEDQFRNTVSLLSEIRFDVVHVAAYSPRPGTKAAREMQDSIPWEIKKQRLDLVEKLQAEIADQINHKLMGEIVEILVENKEKGKWMGRTTTDKPVFFQGSEDDYYGKLVEVKITRASPWSLQGELTAVK